jgi:hypothetical protein
MPSLRLSDPATEPDRACAALRFRVRALASLLVHVAKTTGPCEAYERISSAYLVAVDDYRSHRLAKLVRSW